LKENNSDGPETPLHDPESNLSQVSQMRR
jgi:hypothetical protein